MTFAPALRTALVAVLVVGIGAALPAAAQANPPPDRGEPAPYEKDEFPEFVLALRRGEIIALGTFPFSFFFAGLAYDLFRYSANGFDARYAPGPFRSPGGDPLTPGEQYGIIGAAVGLSILLAIIDHALGASDAPPSP